MNTLTAPSLKRRAVVTGWSAVFASPLLGRVAWTSRGPDTLRATFERAAGLSSTAFDPLSASDGFDCALQLLDDELRRANLRSEVGEWSFDPDRVGVCLSGSKGRLALLERGSWGDAFAWAADAPAHQMARHVGASGPLLAPSAACASGAHAVALGAQMIEDGRADVVLCGGVEPSLTPFVMAAYKSLGALSKSGVMRPFDLARDGFVPSQGTGVLILEAEDTARQRGAKIVGALAGYSMLSDAHSMTAMSPSGDTIARAVEDALRRAGVSRADYVNAHGTATRLNDDIEARGITLALGANTPVSATKPLTGHLLGAAGAVEAVLCLMALRESWLPPTLNLQEAGAAIGLDCVPRTGRCVKMQTALSLSYGFGGHIGALALTKN